MKETLKPGLTHVLRFTIPEGKTVPHLFPESPGFAAMPRVLDEMSVGAAILLTVLGMALHWQMPRRQMSYEERVKDGTMTEEEARKRIRFYMRSAPITTLLGVGVLLYVMFDLSR